MLLRQFVKTGHIIQTKQSLPVVSQVRNVTIVKRVYRPRFRLYPNAPQKEYVEFAKNVPRNKFQQYWVEEEKQDDEEVKVILLRTTDDHGQRGQILTVKGNFARKHLLLPGIATYASEENLEKYKDILIPEDAIVYSSLSAQHCARYLSRYCIGVRVHRYNPWTIEPWHIRSAFLKQNVVIPLENIEMGSDPIKGPDMSLENKEFFVYVTINNFEKVPVRCVLTHYSNDETENAKTVGWQFRFHEPIFEKDRDFLRKMSRQPFGEKAAEEKTNGEHIEMYKQWKRTREAEMNAAEET